jgi:hypothetical protein
LERVIVYTRTYDIHKAVAIVQHLKEKKVTMQNIGEIQPLIEEDK